MSVCAVSCHLSKNPILIICCLVFTCLYLGGQTMVSFNPIKDCTIFQGNQVGSNGAGSLFSGRTQGNLGTSNRRALLKFDISSLPANAFVTAATLSITGSRGSSSGFDLHRLTADWGEGSTLGAGTGGGRPSAGQNGDATWNSRFLGTFTWNNAGGDFSSTVTASANIGSGSTGNFSSSNLISDIQGWINGSFANHGWLLKGQEGTSGSAVRMNSRESGSNQPTLSITYIICPTDLTLSGNIPSDTYTANETINADGTVADMSIVILNAGLEIFLNELFTVEFGGDLEINLQGCN